jgi:hypothetical protein
MSPSVKLTPGQMVSLAKYLDFPLGFTADLLLYKGCSMVLVILDTGCIHAVTSFAGSLSQRMCD